MNEEYYKNLSFPTAPQSNIGYITELFLGGFFLAAFALIPFFLIVYDGYAFLTFLKISSNLTESSLIPFALVYYILLECIYSYYAIKWYKRRDPKHEQSVYDSWLEERLDLYTQLKSKMSELQLNPISYIDEIRTQDDHHRGGNKILGTIVFVFLAMIFLPILLLFPSIPLVYSFLGVLFIFIFSYGLPILTDFLQPLMDKLFSQQDPDRHLIRALKTGNLNLMIIEVKRMEDSYMNAVSSRNYFASSFFWFCKAELFILNGDILYANQILANLRKHKGKNLILLGQIDLVLALNYITTEKEDQALELLHEAEKIFTKNNITEPLTIIDQNIMLLESKLAK